MAIEHTHITVSKRLVAINSASSVVSRIINLTVLLWVYQFLLKRIPSEEFAVLPVVTAIMVIAPLFFSFFTGGISRYVVEAYSRGEFGRVTGIVSSIVPMLALGTAVFLVIGVGFALHIESVLNIAPQMVGDARMMMLMLVIGFAVQMLALPFGTGFHVRQRFVELNMLQIGRDLTRIAILFGLLLGIGPEVIWVVVATFVSDLVYTATMVLRSRRMVPELRFKPRLFRLRQATELVNFGLWTTLGQLGYIMNTSGITIILNIFGTPVDVTAYHIAVTLYRQLDSLIALASQPLQPALTAMHALGDKARMSSTGRRAGRYALWVSMAIAVPLSIYSGVFVQLYAGAQYAIAAPAIVILMAMLLFTQPTAVLPMTAMATGKVKAFFVPAFATQLLGLGLMLLAASHGYGVIGITLMLTLTIAAGQVFYFWGLFRRIAGIEPRAFVTEIMVPGFLPAATGAVAWTVLLVWVRPDDWIVLFLCALGGGAVYMAALLGLSLQPDEKKGIAALWKRLRAT